MNAVAVKNLTKKYKETQAVKGISFEVKEGELFAFLGENGAGKSTTINMLCTILEKTSGEAQLLGYTLGKDDDKIRDSIGIVFQNSVLDSKLTVKENLMSRGSFYGFSRKEVMDRINQFWDAFKLEEIWKQRYETLSGGQRRRVDIVRALINNPKILFLDEPTTGLDPMSRKIVWDYIDYLRKDKKITIFLTTHYMEETKDADHVVILDKGQIIAEGTPSSLKSAYARTRVIWYTAKSEEDEKRFGCHEFSYDADHYSIYWDNDTDDLIIDFLYKNREVIKDYEVVKGSMDDVFLKLTGKEFQA
mgnify:CR=1 FL=1